MQSRIGLEFRRVLLAVAGSLAGLGVGGCGDGPEVVTGQRCQAHATWSLEALEIELNSEVSEFARPWSIGWGEWSASQSSPSEIRVQQLGASWEEPTSTFGLQFETDPAQLPLIPLGQGGATAERGRAAAADVLATFWMLEREGAACTGWLRLVQGETLEERGMLDVARQRVSADYLQRTRLRLEGPVRAPAGATERPEPECDEAYDRIEVELELLLEAGDVRFCIGEPF